MPFRSVLLRVWLSALCSLACPSLAQSLDYDAFSDRDGKIVTEQHHRAAIELVRTPEQLEAVYADAAAGNMRARRVWEELETNLAAAGVEVAERATRPGCLVPGYRELSQSCIPNWSFLDFLAKDKPGAAQLRQVIFGAFAARARARGLENQAILSVVNGLLGIGAAAAVLREAEAAAKTTLASPPRATTAIGTADERAWSATEGKPPFENALAHWRKHGAEFPEFRTAEQYVEGARRFLNKPPKGTLTKVRPNGEVVVYDPATNTFGVRAADGTPKTLFKPDPAQHHFPTNLDYFNAQ